MTEQHDVDQAREKPHAYYRTYDAKGKNSISAICEKVHSGSLVLDLGAGSGVLGDYLSTEKNCIIDGIDLNLDQSQHSVNYRKIRCANLEKQALATLISGQYDFIICADLLEHLRNPEQLLVQLKDYLKPDGRLLLSVPNVGHIGLVCDLIEGGFKYRSEGLLDNTHVRFFTRHSLTALLHQCGVAITKIETIDLDPRDTEFKYHPASFSPKLFNLLTSRLDAFTYQFIVEADFVDGSEQTHIDNDLEQTHPRVSLSFAARLFWRSDHQNYENKHGITSIGMIGEEKQQLLFEIPAQDQGCSTLRLDPSDRPGYIRIDAIKLRKATGAVVWEWDGRADSLLSLGNRQDVEIAKLDQQDTGAVILIGSTDSYFELPIPAHFLKNISSGGSLEVTQSFPMSADYLALSPRLALISQRQTEQIDELKGLIALRDSELAVRDATIRAHQSKPGEREQLIINQQHQIEELKHLSELQAQQIQEREQLIDERDKWLQEKQDRAERQYDKMQELEALMKKHNIDMTRRTSHVEFREQSIGQQLQIRDDSINTLNTEIETLQQQLEYRMSMEFWLQRPLIYLRDRLLNKFQ